MIETITIFGGHSRDGKPETVERIDLKMGDVVSIVGPTGSGKTTFINDIELFANGNTQTGRRILINGEQPPVEYRDNPSLNPIALITQHTTFLSDLPVLEFLTEHAGIRVLDKSLIEQMIADTLSFANQLTGEPINPDVRMTELSGGQTRALLCRLFVRQVHRTGKCPCLVNSGDLPVLRHRLWILRLYEER